MAPITESRSGKRAAASRTLLPVPLACALLLWAAAAWADAPGAADGTANELPAVRVTGSTPSSDSYSARAAGVGSLGDERPLDTPRSISVYTRQFLDDLQPADVNQILRLDPAVGNTSAATSAARQFTVRGIGINVNSNYKQDGLTIRWADVPLENVEQIEVLKGTSALLYGFSTPGGVINFVTKKPLAQPLTQFGFQLNDHGGATGRLDVSRRFNDGATGLRMNLAREAVRTYVDESRGTRQMAALALEQQIGVATLSLEGDWQDSQRKGVYDFISGTGFTQLPDLIDPSTFVGQPWATQRNVRSTLQAKLQVPLNETWSLLVQANRFAMRYTADAANAGAVQGDGRFTATESATSQRDVHQNGRLWLQGRLGTGPLVHHLTFGLSPYSLDRDSATPPAAAAGASNLYAPVALPKPIAAPNLDRYPNMRIRQMTSTAADRVEFNPQWSVLLGANRVHYDFETRNAAGGYTSDYAASRTSPSGAVIFKPDEASTLFLSYAESLESGGNAPTTASNAPLTLPPALTRQFELGAKREWLPGWVATATVFSMQRQNAYVNTANLYVADGLERYRGLELGLAGQVTPALRVTGGTQLLQAQIRHAANPALVGMMPLNVARRTASAFANYDLSAWARGLSLQAGFSAVGRRAATTSNSIFIPGYATFDGGFGYSTRLGNVSSTWQLAVENLANRRYWANSAYGSLAYGAPRGVRGSATFEF